MFLLCTRLLPRPHPQPPPSKDLTTPCHPLNKVRMYPWCLRDSWCVQARRLISLWWGRGAPPRPAPPRPAPGKKGFSLTIYFRISAWRFRIYCFLVLGWQAFLVFLLRNLVYGLEFQVEGSRSSKGCLGEDLLPWSYVNCILRNV